VTLLTRKDREAVGTAGVALALVALMFGFFAFVVERSSHDRVIVVARSRSQGEKPRDRKRNADGDRG
jgi:hypothetical protein